MSGSPAPRPRGSGWSRAPYRPGEHEAAALELAQRFAERPPLALSLAKQVLDHGLDATLEEAMVREVDHAILTSLSGRGRGAEGGVHPWLSRRWSPPAAARPRAGRTGPRGPSSPATGPRRR